MVCPWCGDAALEPGLVPGSWSCLQCRGGFLPQRRLPGKPVAETVVPVGSGGGAASPRPRASQKQLPVDDQHRMVDELGSGGMATVVSAEHSGLRREVAMKILREPDDERLRLRFIEEARITGQLEHPNIVPVHDLGIDRDSGRLFFTMKRVEGQTLEELLDEVREGRRVERTELPELLRVLIGTCNAIGFAHSRGVVHRDLKPANIMTGTFGEVLVMDWGLAKPGAARGGVIDDRDASRVLRALEIDQVGGSHRPTLSDTVTLDGEIVGTIPYMPPEQAEGRIEDIDERSDIYALGAILYEILCLRPPVHGTPDEMLDRIIAGEIDPPQTVAPAERDVPPELAAVAMQALAPDPEERYQSVRELRQDIHRYLENRSVSAKDDSAWEMLVKLLKRNRQVSAAVAAALAVIVAIAGIGYQINSEARRAAENSLRRFEAAQQERLRAESERAASDRQRQALVKQITRESRREWIEVYHSAFEQPEDWHATTGWHVVTPILDEDLPEQMDFVPDGVRLHTTGNLHLVLQRSLSGDMRVRLEATYHGGEDGGMHLSLGGNSWRSGYVIQVGGWRNTLCTVQRGLELGVEPRMLASVPFSLEEGRRYAIEAYAVRGAGGATIELTIDGRQIVHLVDPDPLPASIGRGQGFALMANGPARTTLHSVAIDALNEPLKVELIQAARRQLERGNYDTAIDLFEELAEVQVDAERRLAARRGLEVARRFKRMASKLEVYQQRLREAWPTAQVAISLNQEGMTVDLNGPDPVDLSAMAGLPVTELRIQDCPVADLGPLRDLPLSVLHLSKTRVQDLTPLAGLQLKYLLCMNGPPAPLAPLAGMPLEQLQLGSIQDRDLSVLRGAPLRMLGFEAPQLEDLSALSGMPLVELRLGAAPLTDLAPLAALPLESLELPGCTRLMDIRPLAGIASLRVLDLRGTAVRDLSPLAGGGLEVLRLAGAPVSDLSPLRDLPLQALDLAGSAALDLQPVANRTLRFLDLSGSRCSDLSGLAGGRIGHLDLGGSQVQDLGPLAGHPLVDLSVRDTSVSDLEPLRGAPLRSLDLEGSRVTDLGPILDCGIDTLDLDRTGITAIEGLVGMPLRQLRLPSTLAQRSRDQLRGLLPELVETAPDDAIWSTSVVEDGRYR